MCVYIKPTPRGSAVGIRLVIRVLNGRGLYLFYTNAKTAIRRNKIKITRAHNKRLGI